MDVIFYDFYAIIYKTALFTPLYLPFSLFLSSGSIAGRSDFRLPLRGLLLRFAYLLKPDGMMFATGGQRRCCLSAWLAKGILFAGNCH